MYKIGIAICVFGNLMFSFQFGNYSALVSSKN